MLKHLATKAADVKPCPRADPGVRKEADAYFKRLAEKAAAEKASDADAQRRKGVDAQGKKQMGIMDVFGNSKVTYGHRLCLISL